MKTIKEHYLFQRQMIGWLCVVLAPLCVLAGLPFYDFNAAINPGWWNTVSETYYASSKMIMIGLLMSAGLFEITYQGYDWKDKVVNIAAGICCFGVVAFPCGINGVVTDGIFNLPRNICAVLHSISAGLLFTLFAINVLFLFTKTDDKNGMTLQKRRRNRIYYICGGIIVVNLIGMALRTLVGLPAWTGIVFENFMLMPFGIAFVIKGETFKQLND